jgi:peptide deformylase
VAEEREQLVEVEELEDEAAHEPLDPQVAARRAAALAHVRRFGDPIGLAAPQIGVSQQLLVYRLGQDAPVIALVNPELEWSSEDEESFEEGCLSIPGIAVDVDRAIHVRVRAQDELGDERVVEASGLEARVIQHEIDHLNGVLILDRTTKEQRREAIRSLREAEAEAA